MVVSIHQPNFFPWLPFFEKMRASDKFIVLNNCQFEKNNYQNRFFYRERWQTLSINKGLDMIHEKEYVNPVEDWERIKKRLEDKRKILEKFDECIEKNLSVTNVKMIRKLCALLEIDTEILFDEPTDLKSTDRLVAICQQHGASKYLAGSGSKKYLDVSKFEDVEISVEFQEIDQSNRKHVLDVLL